MPKQARASLWPIKPGSDGRRWSQWPQGDRPGGAGYTLDFTAAAIQDPLSDGGIWTNNSQGTGGNGVMGTLQSMRVALASDGTTKIAQHSTVPETNYDDCFAFVPGISGNQRVTTTIYKTSGYAPSSNHEVEHILGCRVVGNANRRWIELLWQVNGNVDIALQDGVNSGFTILGNISNTGVPANGDVMVSELDRSARTAKFWRNGTLMVSIDWNTTGGALDATVQSKLDDLGDGAGIAGYMIAGDTNPGGYGFRDFLVETF